VPDCLQTGFWSHFFDGLTLGSIYAMIALGYTMVYGVLQLINFAHSEVFMIGTFGGMWMTRLLGVEHPAAGAALPLLVAAVVLPSMAMSGAAAVVLERVAYRPLRRRGAPRLAFLITAIGASIFLSNLFFVRIPGPGWTLGGPAPVPYRRLIERSEVVEVFGYSVSNKQVLVVVTMVLMYLFLDRFVMGTRAGRAIRALAEDAEAAQLMGVPVDRTVAHTFLLGGLMAGAAGSLYGLFFEQAQFNIGFIPGIKAFTAAVLGGIGNIRGAMLGGVLLGLVENVGVACTETAWQDVIAFVILVAVLMFRPTGLLGERVRG
jgi:branched-chain amino acid transport system permease protein